MLNVEIITKLDLPISTVHKKREGLRSASSTATQDKYMVLNIIYIFWGGEKAFIEFNYIKPSVLQFTNF